MIAPKTIVITTIPNKTNIIASVGDHCISRSNSLMMESGTRKRRRMTNLSADERLMRRKLKNRVAAQTARDRKKARMGELEETLAELEEENLKLQTENANLKKQTGDLATENCALKERLNLPNSDVVTKRECESPCESAVLANPLLQERICTLFHLMTHCAAFLLTLRLISLASSKKLPLQNKRAQSKTETPVSNITPPMWWGPQQQSWNPSKNL